MRLVRIDRLAPGGAALELHPRLTVLAGAPPELRRRLAQAVRSLVDGSEPECDGVIEVSGVRLAFDRATLDQLRLDPRVDPVLSFGEGGPSAPAASAGAGGDAGPGTQAPPGVARPFPEPAAPVEHGFSPRRAHANPFAGPSRNAPDSPREALRGELRRVTEQRTALAERMEATRQGLDSFSRAALDVVRGQIEALESRRSTLRRQWEEERARAGARRAEIERELSDHRSALQALGSVDPSAVSAARELLAATLEVPDRPDPAAADLADQLDAARREVAERDARSAERTSGYEEASRELVEARRELAEAERVGGGAAVDPAAVRRLEQIREELFASDERAGRLTSTKGRRRIQELRAEEAVLLDRLGFDTYSAYVMGIPSVRAGLERNETLAAARERVERAEAHLGAIRAAQRDDAAVRRSLSELVALVERAETMLDGSARTTEDTPWFTRATSGPETPAPGTWSPEVADSADTLRRAEAASARLRARRSAPPAPDSPPVREAMRSLDAALGHAGVATHDLPTSGPGAPRALLHAADRWLSGLHERAEAARSLQERIAGLEAELARIDAAPEPERDVARWAQVEADLDAALDRLAEAEERVRAHEEAMDRLADLRAEELALRERERALLAEISRSEGSGTARTGVPSAPPPFRGVPPVGGTAEAPAAGPATAVADGAVTDLHWRLVARLAEQRAVSFAGSLPLLVEQLPAEPGLRDRLLERMGVMADLVQIVVVSDDPEVRAWADGQDHLAACVALQ